MVAIHSSHSGNNQNSRENRSMVVSRSSSRKPNRELPSINGSTTTTNKNWYELNMKCSSLAIISVRLPSNSKLAQERRSPTKLRYADAKTRSRTLDQLGASSTTLSWCPARITQEIPKLLSSKLVSPKTSSRQNPDQHDKAVQLRDILSSQLDPDLI
ncbi:hypothetical protein F511_22252 [Dorcoceras hygrometricum]|uniref:Uncharacterized protein n=1 Tax=Dorcoceras hygrometricum TaxID=472368 RepID=A0A2Z7CNC2_9LAMI|nr:hypothetical protein F511_22252 [Dorcoceras hygrometricum]